MISSSCSMLRKSSTTVQDEEKKNLQFIYLFDEAGKNRLNGNLQKASEQYTAALEINPNSAASDYYTASIYTAKKDYSSALTYVTKAYDLQSDNFWYGFEKADLLNHNGYSKEAAALYRQLLKNFPDKKLVYDKLIQLYKNNKDLNNLISVYQLKQKQTGYLPETAVTLFNLFLKAKNFTKAEQTIVKLQNTYPENFSYQGMAAEYYYSVNQYVKAETIYSKLLKKHPDNADVNLSYALFCRKTNKKIEYFNTVKKLINSDLNFIKKTSLLMYGQYHNFPDNEYFELLQLLYKKHPSELLSNTFFAEYYIDKNTKEKAIPYIRKSLELNPSDFNMALMLFSLTYDEKDFKNLSKDTEKYLSYFPNQPRIFLYKGIAEYELQNYEIAEKFLKYGNNLIVDNIPLEDQFSFYLALIYKNTKQFKKALTLAETIIKHKNKNIKIYELYGDLLFTENKKKEALKYWNLAKERKNNSTTLIYKINNFKNLTLDDLFK